MVLTNYWGREKYIKFSIILVFIPKVISEVGIFLMEKKRNNIKNSEQQIILSIVCQVQFSRKILKRTRCSFFFLIKEIRLKFFFFIYKIVSKFQS